MKNDSLLLTSPLSTSLPDQLLHCPQVTLPSLALPDAAKATHPCHLLRHLVPPSCLPAGQCPP